MLDSFALSLKIANDIRAYALAKCGNSKNVTQYIHPETGKAFEVACYFDESTETKRVFIIDKAQLLGERGGQGAVYPAVEIPPKLKKLETLKVVACKYSDKVDVFGDFRNEAIILHHLERKIGELSRESDGENYFYLFSSFCPGDNLLRLLYEYDSTQPDCPFVSKRPLGPAQIILLTRAIISAVLDLHEKHVYHRDLKPANFMHFQGKVCLIDFGTSTFADKCDKTFKGTEAYAAPETLKDLKKRNKYNIDAEYYSLGVTLAEVLSKKNFQEYCFKPSFDKLKYGPIAHGDLVAFFDDIFTIPDKLSESASEEEKILWSIKKLTCKLLEKKTYNRPGHEDVSKILKKLKTYIDFYMRESTRERATSTATHRTALTRVKSSDAETKQDDSDDISDLVHRFKTEFKISLPVSSPLAQADGTPSSKEASKRVRVRSHLKGQRSKSVGEDALERIAAWRGESHVDPNSHVSTPILALSLPSEGDLSDDVIASLSPRAPLLSARGVPTLATASSHGQRKSHHSRSSRASMMLESFSPRKERASAQSESSPQVEEKTPVSPSKSSSSTDKAKK